MRLKLANKNTGEEWYVDRYRNTPTLLCDIIIDKDSLLTTYNTLISTQSVNFYVGQNESRILDTHGAKTHKNQTPLACLPQHHVQGIIEANVQGGSDFHVF